MNLKDQLKEKKSQLLELKEGVESGDAEATASAKSLVEDITSLKEQIKVAEEKAALLTAMNADEPVNPIEQKETKMELKDLVIAAHEDFTANGKSGSVESPELNFKAATDATEAYAVEDHRNALPKLQPRAVAADMLGAASTSGNSVVYIVEKPDEGAIGVNIAQGGKKGQVHMSYEEKDARVEKIAGFYYMTSELAEDQAFIANGLTQKLVHKTGVAEDTYVVDKLVNWSGIQTAEYDATAKNAIADAVLDAKSAIKTNSTYNADGIFINPADLCSLQKAKDGNDQYYGGGYFSGAYGNGGISTGATIWGLPVFVTSDIEQGTILVGAFKDCATVYRRNGMKVDMTESNKDQFEHNLITVRCEERLAVAVEVPAGIVKITAAESE